MDKMISAIEFVPGNKKIVRQSMISVDTSSRVEYWDNWDPQYGYFSFGEIGLVPKESRWYSWHPGKGMTQFPAGKGLYLPKGAKVLLHLHYGPTGVPEKDASRINLQFAKAKHPYPALASQSFRLMFCGQSPTPRPLHPCVLGDS